MSYGPVELRHIEQDRRERKRVSDNRYYSSYKGLLNRERKKERQLIKRKIANLVPSQVWEANLERFFVRVVVRDDEQYGELFLLSEDAGDERQKTEAFSPESFFKNNPYAKCLFNGE